MDPGARHAAGAGIDVLAWLILLVVTGIGALVLAYCARYFSSKDRALGSFAGVLVAFAGAMAGLIAADDVMLLFIFWELTTVFSYLLIGHKHDHRAARRAAVNALLPTTAGGLAMMVGLLMVASAARSTDLSAILASDIWSHGGPFLVAAVLLILAGAATKSALVPSHFWLPGAMAAPTPVSAYLHAAAMVKAGIYLILRFGPALAHMPLVVAGLAALGATTMIVGGWRALRQHDIKLLLAFGTVSQLGFLAAISAIASPGASIAALALLLAHATFKAPLFMVVGIIDTTFRTRDLRELDRVGRRAPVLAIIGIASAASMAAIPPLYGFIAKEAVFTALWEQGAAGRALLAALVVGSALTVAYSWRFVRGAFGPADGPAGGLAPGSAAARAAASFERRGLRIAPAFWAPAGVIALAALALIPLSPALGHLLVEHARTMPSALDGAAAEAVHLGPVPHLGAPLLASIAALALGGLLILLAGPVERTQAAVAPRPESSLASLLDSERLFRRTLRGTDRAAALVTSLYQRGSLPYTIGTILMVLIGLGTWVLAFKDAAHLRLVAWMNPAEPLVLVVVAIAAIGTVRSRRRLRAALLATATGFGCAVLFAIWGGIDVATTQVLVETILTVVLVLVLRRLPPRFSRRTIPGDTTRRALVAAAAATVLCLIAAVAAAARVDAPLGRLLLTRAPEIGGGHNVVNVVLVDARVWDTMGEISVLLVVATGVASLVFVTAREQAIARVRDLSDVEPVWRRGADARSASIDLDFDARPARTEADGRWLTWLAAGVTLAPERRLVILEVLARLMFPLMMLFSVYLLLAGHDHPGGGFAGGLVAGLALTLRYLAGARYELAEALPLQPGALLGSGLVLAVAAGIAPVALGGTIFQSAVAHLHLPVLGELHVASAMVFDIGVYLLVLGVVLDFLRSLGSRLDRQIEEEHAAHAEAADATSAVRTSRRASVEPATTAEESR